MRAEDLLATRGVSRREFLAYLGSVTALLGLSSTAVPRIAAALEEAAGTKPVVWLDLGSCGGCTRSLMQADAPDVATIVLDLLSVDYATALMAASGSQAMTDLRRSMKDGEYIAVVEGAVMTAEGGNRQLIGGQPGTKLIHEVCSKARSVVAVGSCAVDGGWVAASRDSGAEGIGAAANRLGIDPRHIVNLPGCPANPRWISAVLLDMLVRRRTPLLDSARRPTAIYGSTVHDSCPRRGHFENGEFVEQFGTLEESEGFCLFKMGCKGPETLADCPTARWNGRSSWCVEAGSPCIGCTQVFGNWVDSSAPFLSRMQTLGTGFAGSGLKPETIATVVAAGAAGAFALYGVAETARGRLRAVDEEPKGDRSKDVAEPKDAPESGESSKPEGTSRPRRGKTR